MALYRENSFGSESTRYLFLGVRYSESGISAEDSHAVSYLLTEVSKHPAKPYYYHISGTMVVGLVCARIFRSSSAGSDVLKDTFWSRSISSIAMPPRVHVLGLGSIGTFAAHSLAEIPNRPSIILLLHRASLLDGYIKNGNRILLETRRGDLVGYDITTSRFCLMGTGIQHLLKTNLKRLAPQNTPNLP